MNDIHNETNEKIDGEKNWDGFVAVGRIGKEYLPIVFKVRTINSDVRSQIYSLATKESLATPTAANDDKKASLAHPIFYGESPSSRNRVTQVRYDVKQLIQAVFDKVSPNHAEQMEWYTEQKDSDPEAAQRFYDGLMETLPGKKKTPPRQAVRGIHLKR